MSVTPPLVWRAASAAVGVFQPHNRSALQPGEQDAAYYNRMYQDVGEYRKHYTASRYYFLWCVIVDRLKRASVKSVLDIGCGAGQFGSLLRDSGVANYCGLDLSENAIRTAKAICSQYKFVAGSVFDSDLLERFDYDAVVSLEFLEHVEEDLAVLGRIRPGKRFLGSVPNFPYESHVRHFDDCQQVIERYGPLFTQLTVDAFLAGDDGMKYFLIEGVKA
jgi:2-polyprenyl-3-methyl-5-hydroxy-6-metoxy-1,4-benzoquinol methylase